MKASRRGLASGNQRVHWQAPALAAGCLLFSALLFGLGRPAGSEARVAALESKLKALQAAERMPGDLSAFPTGSVCRGKLPQNYADQLRVALSGGGLEVQEVILTGGIDAETTVPLEYYGVTLKAKGTYEAAVAGVSAVGRLGPILFVDAASLRNRSTWVDLELKGRVFCRS